MAIAILHKKDNLFQEKINNAPRQPGCYIYKDKSGDILYIGKAKILKNRVKSYFSNYAKLDIKIQNLINQAEDIEYLIVDSEVEALILETNLIKKYKPKYNSMMMDDKNYIWVKFDKVKRRMKDFPRIRIVRKKDDKTANYFGPYPNTVPVKNILKRLRRLFPYIANEHKYSESYENLEEQLANTKNCLYHHINLCPCGEKNSKKIHMHSFRNIKKFFNGEKVQIQNKLENKMALYAKKHNFENAAIIRDKINDIKYVTANIRIDTHVDDTLVSQLRKESKDNALEQLISVLNFNEKIKPKIINSYKNKTFRMECYDISNTQGTNATGSMVVMINGEIRPDLYRRFRIKMKNEPNDFAMMQEVLARRFQQYLLNEQPADRDFQPKEDMPKNLYKRMKNWKKDESFSQTPDLLIIDGGKGQLASTYEVLKSFSLHEQIPIIGLAKREEEIFFIRDQINSNKDTSVPYNNSELLQRKFARIKLSKKTPSLQMIQRIRDEAHRFAITYHKKLRAKDLLKK
ncbi:MAG: GIY-YIG nuclease family protein [Desulfobacteraceae bacterium]|nr:GIY-YIG nuclease family protein [Desulfobacteraceae bacterium]